MPLTACLLHYDPASCWSRARLRSLTTGAEAKASLNRAKSSTWPQTRNRSDLPMARVKLG
jgi:hypothetical protein